MQVSYIGDLDGRCELLIVVPLVFLRTFLVFLLYLVVPALPLCTWLALSSVGQKYRPIR